jgi:hypothetical protein
MIRRPLEPKLAISLNGHRWRFATHNYCHVRTPNWRFPMPIDVSDMAAALLLDRCSNR